MFNTIAQRESLALALAAGARLKKYNGTDEGQALDHVVETVKAASCGMLDDVWGDGKNPESQAVANGAAPEVNGAATAEPANNDRDGHGRFAKGNRGGV